MSMVSLEDLFPWLIPYRPYLIAIGLITFTFIVIGSISLWTFEQYEKWQNYKVLKELQIIPIWDLVD